MVVSEIFYALQGEGPSIGIPAVFVRMAGCNLNCVWCDSVNLWKRGDEYTAEELSNKIIELAGLSNLQNYNTHVVITGGEPLLWVSDLSNMLDNLFQKARTPNTPQYLLAKPVYVEIETNGTVEAERFLKKYVTQINCSPKLANSNEPLDERRNPESLDGILNAGVQTVFKFVVNSEEDWQEILDTYIAPGFVARDQIYLMPKANNREELLKNSPTVWDIACREHVAVTTRLHMITFDTRQGV